MDDEAFLALEHPSGVRSHLWMSKVAAQHGPRFRVLGAQAAFTKYGLDGQEPALLDGAVPGRAGYGEEPPERFGSLGQEGTQEPTPTVAGCYQRFYEGVVDALRNGAKAPVDPREAISALEVIEAARTSASRGQVERLGVPGRS